MEDDVEFLCRMCGMLPTEARIKLGPRVGYVLAHGKKPLMPYHFRSMQNRNRVNVVLIPDGFKFMGRILDQLFIVEVVYYGTEPHFRFHQIDSLGPLFSSNVLPNPDESYAELYEQLFKKHGSGTAPATVTTIPVQLRLRAHFEFRDVDPSAWGEYGMWELTVPKGAPIIRTSHIVHAEERAIGIEVSTLLNDG